jgi:homoserine O-acetyltransferase/O-succinyltransferase
MKANAFHLKKAQFPSLVLSLGCLLAAIAPTRAAEYPAAQQADYVLKDFHFNSGETLPELKLHYRFIGTPQTNAQGVTTNAVLIMHGTTGTGGQFTVAGFGGVLFGPGQLLDATKYFLLMPDDIGHGQSSRPSEGLHAKFPKYGYRDMITAQYKMLTEGLKVNHLRLVMGTSMGGMHTWLWGEMYPDYIDALMPLASVPTQIYGRNRMWRRIVIDEIRNDPTWENGEYTSTPRSMKTVAAMMDLMADNPVNRYKRGPTLAAADRMFDQGVANYVRTLDANNTLYAYESSRDYDPGPDLEKIKAPLLAVNSADDLINPPEIGSLEEGIKKVKNGKAVVIPYSNQTVGHGTHTKAVIWKDYLAELLKESEHP